jgi:maltooligosyltrehalose synthase
LKEHLIGYVRTLGEQAVVTLLPRFACTLMDGKPRLPLGAAWGDAMVHLPGLGGRELRNVFTDEVVSVDEDGAVKLSEVFANFPVGLLTTG